jgi:hypothetical protein
MGTNPATIEGLDVNEVKDGLVVYDPARDRVHYLNATASVVFTLCDGTNDREVIAGAVAEAFALDVAPLAEVETCLEQLDTEGLLRSPST